MIELPRNQLDQQQAAAPPKVLVLAVGNAGVALADRLILAGSSDRATIIAINTDSTSLDASVAETRLLIGSKTARGLGTGGDPDLGGDAVEESFEEIAAHLTDAQFVLLCAGLGGGVGSGALPLLAKTAKSKGALVIAVGTRPFSFEGKRRASQADAAADALGRHADAVLLFDNDRMADLAEPLAGVHETFSASDDLISDTIASILRLTHSSGPLPVTLPDLISLFRQGAGSCAFGSGRATGRNRAHDAVTAALKNPMLDRGNCLPDARTALIRIEGPADLRFAEVQAAAQSLSKKLHEACLLQLAVDILDDDAAPLTVSILATSAARPARAEPIPDREPLPIPKVQIAPPIQPASTPQPAASTDEGEELFDTDPYTVPKSTSGKKAPKPKQETLSLDPVNRGRFDKSEPTIVGGEDLDVPTFIRQKTRLS